ncbi:MAG: hypothetical protein H6733_07035 [Alphaproteobacteria bacterium]|nr:hypothetical protein [Alphaproteobacteria bacterium]
MRTLTLLLLVGCGTPAAGTFTCGGKSVQTVSASAVCDGVIDCWGGQDERQADCATEVAYCDQPEPQAVLAAQVCDGTDDCNDGFDESACD